MAKRKKKRGRPVLPRGASKARVLTVRLQAGDYKALTAMAKKDGQGLSEWVRAALIHRAKAVRIENTETEGVGIEPHR